MLNPAVDIAVIELLTVCTFLCRVGAELEPNEQPPERVSLRNFKETPNT